MSTSKTAKDPGTASAKGGKKLSFRFSTTAGNMLGGIAR